MKQAHIEHLLAVERERKPGYFEACLRLGRPIPGRADWLAFTVEDHALIRRDFGGRPTPRIGRHCLREKG